MQLPVALLFIAFARGALSSPLPLTDHVKSLQPRGFFTDLSYDVWNLGSRLVRGTGRWLEFKSMEYRGFTRLLPDTVFPASLADVGGDVTKFFKQLGSEDDSEIAEAMGQLNRKRTNAHNHAANIRYEADTEFTVEDARILYAYAAEGDWQSYRALRDVEKADPKILKNFGVDLTPLKINWQKPAVYTGAAAIGVGASATGLWALSQVLSQLPKPSPPGGVTFETQQSIIQILRDYPDDKDILLKLIDDTPNITPEQRAYFHSVAEEAKKPTEQGRDSRS